MRANLKARTAATHESLDARLAALPLETRAGYGTFLRTVHAAVAPLETHLEGHGVARLLPDWPDRARVAALRGDLQALGLGMAAPVSLRDAVVSDDGAELWGMAYVLEGSRLGGRVLLRRVQASPEVALPAATAYLAHGLDARHWRSFLIALEAAAPDLDAARRGADMAFAAFHDAADAILGEG